MICFTVLPVDDDCETIIIQMSGLQGVPGPQGDAATIEVGTVTTGAPGSDAEVENVGTDEEAILNFTIPRGDEGPQGDTGLTPDLTIGVVTTVAPGDPATASITGTPEDPILNLGIPEGLQGDQGIQGNPGTDGKTILTTSGLPSNGVGVDGDYAYDPTTMTMYGPKTAGVWPAGIELVPNYLRVGAKISNYNNFK